MAWIETKRRKDGTVSYWIRDTRDGRAIVILAGFSRSEAEMKLEQYLIRRDLEKEGYDDLCESMADELFGKKGSQQ